MAKRRKRKLNMKKVIFAIIVALVLLFGIYKGLSFVANSIFNMFSSKDTPTDVIDPNEKEKEEPKYTVTLDPGHGGEDGGTISDSDATYIEKNITLQIAKYIGEELEKQNVKVVYTRDTDIKLGNTNAEGLEYRVNVANDANSDCFVSLHVNSFEQDIKVQGFEVFYNTKLEESDQLGESIIKEVSKLDFIASTKKLKGENLLHIVSKGGKLNIPTVLLEIGYIDDADDLKYLTDETKLRKLAKYIANGIVNNLEGTN